MKKIVLLSNLNSNALLVNKIKELHTKKNVRLAYIPSQTDSSRKYFNQSKDFFYRIGIQEFLYFDVDREYDESLIPHLLECDAIYLSGGNTFRFLQNLQSKGLLPLIKARIQQGVLYIGVSAGAIMLSETIQSAKYIDENDVGLSQWGALHEIEFDFMPHWESQHFIEERLRSDYVDRPLYTCSDGDGIIIHGADIHYFGDIYMIAEGKKKRVNKLNQHEDITNCIKGNYSRILSTSDRKKVVKITNGKVEEVGYTTEELTVHEQEDKLVRKQSLVFVDGTSRSVKLTMYRSDFQPISLLDQGQNSLHTKLLYQKKEVEVITNHQVQVLDLEPSLFDLFSIEIILRLLPLEEGYQAECKVFSSMKMTMILVRIHVTGREKMFNGNYYVDSWKTNVYFGEELQTYWIDTDNIQLLKQSVKMGEDSYFEFVR